MRAAGAILLIDLAVVQASFLFNDIRPRSYLKGNDLDIHVGNLISHQSITAYDFYALNWCDSKKSYYTGDRTEWEAKNFVTGIDMYETQLEESFFKYKIGLNKLNANPCDRKFNLEQVTQFGSMINEGYHFKLFLDGLPAATVSRDFITGEVHKNYFDGVPVGRIFSDKNGVTQRILHNHWDITIKTQPVQNSEHRRIVGFEVEPRSYGPGQVPTLEFKNHNFLVLDEMEEAWRNNSEDTLNTKFSFTYTIRTVEDNETLWANRMEHYLKVGSENIHIAAILLSLLIIVGLSCIVATILKRGLNKDFVNIAKNRLGSNQRRTDRARLPNDEDENRSLNKKKQPVEAEDVAWKKCHGDVMRAPGYPNLLASFVGAGAQMMAMFISIFIGITWAFAGSQWRPYIYTYVMVVMAFFGFINGYVTSRYLKFFGATDWNFSAGISAFVLPLIFIGGIVFESFFSWISGNSLRYSFGDTILRTLGWYFFNASMCYIGAYKGYTQKTEKPKPAIGKVRRNIPDQPSFMSMYIVAPIFGFIQFAAMYAEFTYLFESIFRSRMYAMFGFLVLNMLLLIVIIALLSIISTYMQLCYQNYEWWWRSFFVGGSGGIYIALYAVYFSMTQFDLKDLVSDMSFFVYVWTTIVCYMCVAGFVSQYASYVFVTRIYKDTRSE